MCQKCSGDLQERFKGIKDQQMMQITDFDENHSTGTGAKNVVMSLSSSLEWQISICELTLKWVFEHSSPSLVVLWCLPG